MGRVHLDEPVRTGNLDPNVSMMQPEHGQRGDVAAARSARATGNLRTGLQATINGVGSGTRGCGRRFGCQPNPLPSNN